EAQLRSLIGAIGRQDERALAALYDATFARVYRVALLVTRNAQSAEEVTEDVYWQVWRQALRFDGARGSGSAGLGTLARPRAIDSMRRECNDGIHTDLETWLASGDSAGNEPCDDCEAAQRSDALRAALATLEPLTRELLILAFFRGLTHEDI